MTERKRKENNTAVRRAAGSGNRGYRGRHPARRRRKRRRSFPFLSLGAVLLIVAVLTLGGIRTLKGFLPESHKIYPAVNDGVRTEAMEDYTTIMLFGVDARDGNLDCGNNRSDSMILAAVHKKTGEIRLVSLYRDTYLKLAGDTWGKANGAFAMGGPEAAVSMVNTNFDLMVEDYVAIGFGGLSGIIDCLGGLDLDLDREETDLVNKYVRDMHKESGFPEDELVYTEGTEHLTGIQAVAYSRIRYTAGDDFKRTQRQRTVLEAMLGKIKKANPRTLFGILEIIKEETSTSLSGKEILQLAADIGNYSLTEKRGYPREENRRTGMIGGQDMVIPVTLEENAADLHRFLYGEEDYVPSGTVKERSLHITGLG